MRSEVDSFFNHKIATITVDGAAVNKCALKLLSATYPEINELMSMTESSSRTQIQTEWMRLFHDLTGDEKRKFQAVEKLLNDLTLYDRLESMIKVLLTIFLTLRVFVRSSAGACGWLLRSLFRH